MVKCKSYFQWEKDMQQQNLKLVTNSIVVTQLKNQSKVKYIRKNIKQNVFGNYIQCTFATRVLMGWEALGFILKQ